MSEDVASEIANRLSLKSGSVKAVCDLLSDGYAIAFISQYRKHQTGGLRQVQIHRIAEERRQLLELKECRRAAIGTLQRSGKLTQDLRRAIESARTKTVVDDLLLPYIPKGRTAAAVARERGLADLAAYALAGAAEGADLNEYAANFIDHSREVHTTEDALIGAGHIIAEQFSENAALRQALRDIVWATGQLHCRRGLAAGKKDEEFRDYFDFQERLNKLPPHRILAMNRGERKGVLKVSIRVDEDKLLEDARGLLVPKNHRFGEFLGAACRDAVLRLVLPEVDRQVRADLTRIAERHAIDVFASNVRTLLMTWPVEGQRVLAINPGFRTGCKVAVLDAEGNLLTSTIIYPQKPHKKWIEAKTALIECIRRFPVDVIAIGNGLGCRETEALISEVIADNNLEVQYTVISEAGASAYAASANGKEEFPDLDAALRGTVSIGRRLQDPLVELVKVDPRVIGVGLYQHDVNQEELCRALEETVRDCVAAVGVDLNRVGVPLLSYVPGLNKQLAEAIVRLRSANGPFRNRQQLLEVEGMDKFAFEQAAGFLFISDGDSPFDATRIHPQWYPAAERVLAELGHRPEGLRSSETCAAIRQEVQGMPLDRLAERLKIPTSVLLDIVGEFQNPARDPRKERHGPIFKESITLLEDLKPGMWVKGVVRNVVDFGAFVDIGLEEDGLVHISQFSKRYIRDPLKFLHIGDTIDARILAIDSRRRRMPLSMIREEAERPAKSAAQPAQKPTAEKRPSVPAKAAPSPTQPARAEPLPERRTAKRPAVQKRAGQRRTERKRDEQRGPPRKAPTKATEEKRGGPRVRVFKKSEPEKKPPAGEKEEKGGLPKIRWAHYE